MQTMRYAMAMAGAHAASFASVILAFLLSVGSEWDGIGVRIFFFSMELMWEPSACMHTRAHTCTHGRMHGRMHIHTYAHAHTHTDGQVPTWMKRLTIGVRVSGC